MHRRAADAGVASRGRARARDRPHRGTACRLGEFAHSSEYAPPEVAMLARRRGRARMPKWPPPLRPAVPVATVPAITQRRRSREYSGALRRLHDRKGQGRRGPVRDSPTTSTGSRTSIWRSGPEAGSSGSMPAAAGMSKLGDGRAQAARGIRAEYGAACARVEHLKELQIRLARNDRGADRGRRVDPQRPRPAASGLLGGGRPDRRQGRPLGVTSALEIVDACGLPAVVIVPRWTLPSGSARAWR